MAVIKSGVTVFRAGTNEALADGMIYLHVGQDRGSGNPRVQGTISPLNWKADEFRSEDHAPGTLYRAVFDDGRTLNIVLTRRIFSACGPEIFRFTAEEPAAAAALAETR